MADKKQPKPDTAAIKPNREQRRREKFGRAGGEAKDLWPESEANPAFTHATPADEVAEPTGEPTGDKAAHAGRPDQDVTHQTGPGSGGATEEAKRPLGRKGSQAGNSAKG